jgi:hypothetical protein
VVVTWPRAAVRLTIKPSRVDDRGCPTADELRRIRALLWDLPEGAVARIDISPLRGPGPSMVVDALAALPCARSVWIEIEHPDWRIAAGTALELISALGLEGVS